MELNKQTIRSLSSDTRVGILKSLARRRKMPAELAKELGLAASTVSEHLKNLEDSRLIKKKETGHKWIYYELTEKGQTLVQPQYSPQFVVVLVLGGLMFLAGFTTYLVPFATHQTNMISQFGSLAAVPEIQDNLLKENAKSGSSSLDLNLIEAMPADPSKVQEAFSLNAYTIILLVLGLLLMAGSFFFPKKYALEV